MFGLKPLRQDAFSAYTHLYGAFFAIIGLAFLIWRATPHIPLIIVSAVYACGAILMLLSSAFYHAFKKAENQSGILRKLDHISIFVMIAGTFTPLCYGYLTGAMRWSIISAQWLLVIVGFFQSIYFIKAPRIVTTIIYLLMGWMAVVPIKQLITNMTTHSIILLVSGGVAYSIGAICYMVKKPNPVKGFLGFHEIFHLFILIGVVLHYFVVWEAIGRVAH